MKPLVMLIVIATLAGCGSGKRVDRGSSGQVTRFSSGPISKACLASDRKARSSRLCGCIQTVANRSLSSSDQRLAATFFRNPQKAQDTRQSDRASHEVFWKKYKAFASSAENSCRGY